MSRRGRLQVQRDTATRSKRVYIDVFFSSSPPIYFLAFILANRIRVRRPRYDGNQSKIRHTIPSNVRRWLIIVFFEFRGKENSINRHTRLDHFPSDLLYTETRKQIQLVVGLNTIHTRFHLCIHNRVVHLVRFRKALEKRIF